MRTRKPFCHDPRARAETNLPRPHLPQLPHKAQCFIKPLHRPDIAAKHTARPLEYLTAQAASINYWEYHIPLSICLPPDITSCRPSAGTPASLKQKVRPQPSWRQMLQFPPMMLSGSDRFCSYRSSSLPFSAEGAIPVQPAQVTDRHNKKIITASFSEVKNYLISCFTRVSSRSLPHKSPRREGA